MVDMAKAQQSGTVITQFQPFSNIFKDTTVDKYFMAPVGPVQDCV